MQKLLLGVWVTMATACASWAGTYVWTGNAGDGKWATPQNWQGEACPSCTEADEIEIDIGDASLTLENDLDGVQISKLTVKGVNDKVFTLNGKPLVFAGTSSGDTLICTNGCSVTYNVDMQINGSGKFVLGGPYSTFNGDVAVAGESTLKFYGRPLNATRGPEFGYADLIGNKVETTFYGTFGGPEATLYISLGANGNGTPAYFHGPVVCQTLLTQTGTKPCTPHFCCSSGNHIAEWAFFASANYIDEDNSLGEDMTINPQLAPDNSYVWNGNLILATGSEQIVNRLEGASESVFRGRGKNFGFNIFVGGTAGNTANAATLTIRNTADAISHMQLGDALNVVLDAKGAYTQAFEDCLHLTRGEILVKAGTFRTCGTNVFLNLTRASVKDGATLEIASTNADYAAFNALRQLDLASGARLVIGDADVNAFPANFVAATLAEGAKIVVPAGANIKLGRLALAGNELSAATYSGEDWIEGAGSVTVSGEVPAGQNIWWKPTSGAWTEAANWLSGQVPGSSDTAIVNAEGTYTVTYDSTAVKPQKIVLETSSGLATLKLDGDVSFNSGDLQIGRNARLEIPATASLTCNGAPNISVTGGEVAVNGGTLAATNFAGTFTVSGSASYTGRVAAVGGLISHHPDGTGVDRLITLQKNGELTLSENAVFQSLLLKQRPLCLRGGRLLVADSAFFGSSNRWTFTEGETVFSGTATVVCNYKDNQCCIYPETDGQDAHFTMKDHASFIGPRFDTLHVGDDGNNNGAAADTTVDFDSDRLLQGNNDNMIAYGTLVASRKGKATLNLRRGWLHSGQRGLRIGAANGSRYGLRAFTGYKGTVNVYGGALVVPANTISEGFTCGLTLGDGGPVDESVRATTDWFEGTFNQFGGVVTNSCNLLVGGPRGRGAFAVTGGEYRSHNWGYPVMVGAAGGKGTCLIGGGTVYINSQAYVGGAFTNAIPHNEKYMAYGLAAWGWPLDDHTAEGTLTVTGGVVTLRQDLNVGFDGKGTVAVEGTLPTISVVGNLVLSNTVETATSSTLRFKFDANGVSPIQVDGKFVNTAGTKLRVDLGAYAGRKCTHYLVTSAGGLEGPAITDVEITGDLAGRAYCETTNRGLFLRLQRGLVINLR